MAPLSLLGTNPCTVGIEEVRKKAAFFPSVTQFIRSGILFNSRLQVYNFHLATSCFIVLHRCFILCELCRSRFDLQKYSHFTKHLDKWYCQQMQQRNGWGDSPCAAHILFKDSLVPLSHCRSWADSVTVLSLGLDTEESRVFLGGAMFVCTCVLELWAQTDTAVPSPSCQQRNLLRETLPQEQSFFTEK